MDARHLLNRLSFMAAIAMLLAAFADRGEARPRPAAVPPVPVFNQDLADEKKDEKEANREQPISKQELAGRSPYLVQQQKRVERLQSRL